MPVESHSVKVVFFDAAGTLFRLKESVGDIYLHYAKSYGVTSSEKMKKAINVAFQEAFRAAPPAVFATDRFEKLKQCERLWWFDLVHAVFYRVGMFEGFDDFFEDVFQAFTGATHWVLEPDALPVLKTLKTAGFELGIISNFDTRLFGIVRELGLSEWLDSMTISSLAGAVKPSPRIFQFALDQHAMEPNEALHIGDSVKEDYEGAKRSGLHGVLLSRTTDTQAGCVCLKSLHELPLYLSRLSSDPG